jgi:hypothetical protein
MWRSTRFAEGPRTGVAVAVIAVGVAAFLLAVGLGPDALPYPPASQYSDAALTHWPNALYLYRNGFALWNPRIMSGLPFAANPLSKMWYPPQWLALILPPTLHLNLMTWLHLTLAGAGMWAWARASGMHPLPAALAAAAYAFAPKTIAHLGAGHLDIVYAMGWFPWLLWAVFLGARRAVPSPRGSVHSGLRLGAVAALLFLADVRISVFAYATAAAYALWLSLTLRPPFSDRDGGSGRARSAPLVIGVGLAAALTAAQWVPLAALAPYLSRGTLTPEDAGVFFMQPEGLLGTVLGNHAGFHETMAYAGLTVLLLAGVGLLKRPRRLFFWAGTVVVAVLYALGPSGPLWPALTGLFPPLLWLRAPGRAWFVVTLGLPYLAGWGAQALAQGRVGRGRARMAVVALMGGAVACGAASTLMLTSALGAEITVAALVVSLATAAVALAPALAGRLDRRLIAPALLIIALADLAWIDLSLVEGRGRDFWLDPYAELADHLRTVDAGRVYTPSDSLPQQAAAWWEINLFGGVDPFQIQGYVEMAGRATSVGAEGYSPTIPPYTGDGPVETMWAGIVPDAELMSLWNVTHTVSAFPIEDKNWRLDTHIGGVYVYENAGRAETPAPVRQLPDGASAFALPENQSALMVSVPWVPGWEAADLPEWEVGPGPDALTRAENTLDLPMTRKPLQLAYNPQPDSLGRAISAVALIAWLVLFWRCRGAARRAPTKKPTCDKA